MSRLENHINLIGRLTADPELKTTSSGIECCNFTVAVDRYAKKGEDKQTDFINCTAWRQNAAFLCKYFGKGRKIILDGELQTRSYEDKNGNKRTAYDVQVENITFGDSKTDGNGSTQTDTASASPVDDSDLPF